MKENLENGILDQASALLASVEIDIGRLQAEKEKRFPNLTDAEFARLLGVKPATYSDYKNSKQATPSLHVAIRAALALGLDLRHLVPQTPNIEEFFSANLR